MAKSSTLPGEPLTTLVKTGRVETFYRQNDGIWAIGPTAVGISQSMKIRAVDIEIPLSETYAGVELPAVQASA